MKRALFVFCATLPFASPASRGATPLPERTAAFIEENCASCHNDI